MDDIKLWFRERKAVYSTMSLLYRGNLKDGFDILKNTDLLEKLENSNLYPEARAILNEISKDNFNSKYTGELIEDYYRLFFGPSHILAPLWESTYESRDRLIFGRSELSVRMFYHEFDLEVNPKEAADHLAFELSFMSRLCDLGFRGDLKNVMKILGAQLQIMCCVGAGWFTERFLMTVSAYAISGRHRLNSETRSVGQSMYKVIYSIHFSLLLKT